MSIRKGQTLLAGMPDTASLANTDLSNLSSTGSSKVLPTQTSQSGKFLNTNGTDSSWLNIIRTGTTNPTILTEPNYPNEFYLNTSTKALYENVGENEQAYTIYGTLTESSGVYSGFSNDNYIVANESSIASDGEYVVKFTTSSSTPTNIQVICHMEYGLAVEIQSDGTTLYTYNWGTSSSLTIEENITANTTYWVKTVINGTNKIISLSTDGTTYTQKLSYTDTGLSFGNYKLTFGVHSNPAEVPDRSFLGSIDLNESYVKDLDGNYVWEKTAPYVWKKVASEIDESNLVHKTGDETINGIKTFEDLNKVRATASTQSSIAPNTTAIASSPFARDLYHDHFAFKNNGMTIYSQETTTDGETWTTASKTIDNLFIWKDNLNTQILSASELAYRFTLYSTNFNYSNIQWYEIGVAYSNPFSKFDVKIEASTDATTWTTFHSSNIGSNSNPFFLKSEYISNQSYIRFTFTKTTNLDTGIVNINSLKAWSSRKGNQGLGIEYEVPYNWDSNQNILPRSNNARDLGSSSLNWRNVYTNNITASNVTGITTLNATTVNGTTLKANNYIVEADNIKTTNSNLNNYPYHRIAHIELTGSTHQYYDASMIVDLSNDYANGKCGQVKIDVRAASKTQTPYTNVRATWMYRQGYSEDAIQVAYYTYTDTEGSGATTNAYVDIFFKCSITYEGVLFRIKQGARGTLIASSQSRFTYIPASNESYNDTTLTEVYNAIQGTSDHNAAHELHSDNQYTGIITASDGATVKEAQSFAMTDLSGQTISLNDCWVASNGSIKYYKVSTVSSSSGITDKPISENDHFMLCSETFRYLDSSDYRVKQTYISDYTKKTYVRIGNSGTWSAWNDELVNSATGTNSITVGGTATGNNTAVNVGISSTASATNASSLGYYARANGTATISIGSQSQATATQSVAIGYKSESTATGAIVLGSGVNNESKTFKVALYTSNGSATTEAEGLHTILNSSGKIPAIRHATVPETDGDYVAKINIADGVVTQSWGSETQPTYNATTKTLEF